MKNSAFEEFKKPQPIPRLIPSNGTESNLIYTFVRVSRA